MNHFHPRDRLLQLQNLDVVLHEVPLVAAVGAVRAHLLRDERGEPPQHLLVLRGRRRGATWLRLRGGGGCHGAADDDEVGGGREEEQAPEVGGESGTRAHKRRGAGEGSAGGRAEVGVGVGDAAGGAVVGPTGAAVPHTDRFQLVGG